MIALRINNKCYYHLSHSCERELKRLITDIYENLGGRNNPSQCNDDKGA